MLICSVLIVSRLDSQSTFQMTTIFSGRHIGVPQRYTNQHGVFILGSVNLCETFRRISEVWGNAQAQNLEKCLT